MRSGRAADRANGEFGSLVRTGRGPGGAGVVRRAHRVLLSCPQTTRGLAIAGAATSTLRSVDVWRGSGPIGRRRLGAGQLTLDALGPARFGDAEGPFRVAVVDPEEADDLAARRMLGVGATVTQAVEALRTRCDLVLWCGRPKLALLTLSLTFGVAPLDDQPPPIVENPRRSALCAEAERLMLERLAALLGAGVEQAYVLRRELGDRQREVLDRVRRGDPPRPGGIVELVRHTLGSAIGGAR